MVKDVSPMHRVLAAWTGGPAPASIIVEFAHRPWQQNVRWAWDGLLLRLAADNDYDATGLALLDEFSGAVVACINCAGTIEFKVEVVDSLSDKG